MDLPNRIYFTGAPGSKWSGIAQKIEDLPGFNKSDRTADRTYTHNDFGGHKGAYFGNGMEFPADPDVVDNAYEETEGCKLVKSHDWAYDLHGLFRRAERDGDGIMLVYRPTAACLTWWYQAGGFNIKYPNYEWYEDHVKMHYEIERQNTAMLKFTSEIGLHWQNFNPSWTEQKFGHRCEPHQAYLDILVTYIG